MKTMEKIIVSDSSFNSDDLYNIIYSNISVVNLLREEGVDISQIHKDAMTSYYVDYYLAQYKNGNFSQFVWNTAWSADLNDEIINGLKQMGAKEHLALFQEQAAKVDALSADELKSFLDSEYFGENKTRDVLNNDHFFDLEEDLVVLNANWLKQHSDLQVLTIDQMFEALEQFIGRPIERES